MSKAFLIFPHQLFEKNPVLEKEAPIFLIEHPRFFSDFSFHKQKLVLHRASMKAYKAALKRKNYSVRYISYKNNKSLWNLLKKDNIESLHCIDPTDHKLSKIIEATCKKNKIKIVWHESPMFLTPIDWIEKKYGKNKKFRMHSFYVAQRKRLKILVKNGKPIGGTWSFDQENRHPLPENMKIPTLSKSPRDTYTIEAKKYVQKNWQKNPGSLEYFIYPVTHTSAKNWLDRFLKKRLKDFGTYQDAITQDEPFLFHSLLSPLLNIGLLTPEYVIEKTLSYTKKHTIPLNSLEGFIRQIIGWREYVRMVYYLIGKKESKSNFFGLRKKIPKSFWSGTTKIAPIDKTIQKIIKYAYAHHIERLMVLGNFMLLSHFAPKEVYAWFMELSIDSYDWVMVPNVFGMSQYADGGMITTKPYISSSAYILKMSDYQKGAWCEIWDNIFWQFIKKHLNLLKKIPRMGLILNAYKKRKK